MMFSRNISRLSSFFLLAHLWHGSGSCFGGGLIFLDDNILPLVQVLLLQFHQLALDLLALHFQGQLVVVVTYI